MPQHGGKLQTISDEGGKAVARAVADSLHQMFPPVPAPERVEPLPSHLQALLEALAAKD